MAAYRQWQQAMARPGAKPKRITWLCGNPVLEAEALARIKALAGPGHVEWTLAREELERNVWDSCSWIPQEGRHVVVVRAAQRLQHWHQLRAIAAQRGDYGRWLVFVSDEDGYHKTDSRTGKTATDSQGRKLYQPGPAVLRDVSCGQVVRCVLGTDADKLAWVQDRLPGLPQTAAWRVVEHVGGDPAEMTSLCEFLALWPPGKRTEALVRSLAPPREGEEFAHSLITGRKAAAFAHLPPAADTGKAIGWLAALLDTLDRLYAASLSQLTLEECVRAGIPQIQAARYRQVAKSYPPERTRACRTLLAQMDSAYRQGVTEGLAEALAALW